MEYREIEVRFLEINKDDLLARLNEVGAIDLGEDLLKETIFYDQAGKWQYEAKKFARVRQTKNGATLTFKHNESDTATGTKEIELKIDDYDKAVDLLRELSLVAYRIQEKKRHTFKLGEVIVDIDTWPSIPTYVELEGPDEESLKNTAKLLNLDWSRAVFESARFVIEKYYSIPVSKLKFFTFSKME